MAHRRRSRRIQEKEQQQLQQEQGEEDEDASNIQYAKPLNAKANSYTVTTPTRGQM